MDQKLSKFLSALKELKSTIAAASINESGFQVHGWNQVHLNKEQITCLLDNYITKLKSYGDSDITKGLEGKLEIHTAKVQLLNTNSKSYFTNNAGHLIHSVPGILLTLYAIFSAIDYELFSYENIQDKKLLPKGLSTRIRSASTRLDLIDETSSTLKEKITIINEAHEAAESLPTDLASLQEAKKELDNLIKAATGEFTLTRKELALLKESTISLKNDAEKANEAAGISKDNAKTSADDAAKLVEQCDDALQITTTQGLAAGFDQKAKELKNSIWVWVISLLLALGVGAWIGSDRVSALTQAIQSELTVGQAILHAIMSVFSIGGPLWLAWISTQQINQRFKLSEDYSYKATVAKAFTGFSKFAERYDQATEARLFNSTLDRFDEMPLRLIEGKDYNSPWHEFVDSDSFKKALDMVPSLAREAGRFANQTKLKRKPQQTSRSSNIDADSAKVKSINSREESA